VAFWVRPTCGGVKMRFFIAAVFAKKISSIHPLWYMFGYFVMIPVFALLYFLLPPNSFYAPYARFEPAARSDFSRMEGIIGGALKQLADSRDIVVQGWKLNKIVVYGFRSKDGSALDFNIMGVFENSTGSRSVAGVRQQSFAIDLPSTLLGGMPTIIGPRPDETAKLMRAILLNNSAYPADFQTIQMDFYNQLFPTPYLPTGRGFILTNEENREIVRVFDGLQGNPTSVSSAFPRMLYFSAIVITTVGFGDILPLTPMARFFVAIQAVLGVSVAGLFRNALAYRASKSVRS
jgi:hypothetical protein